jgi:hypothetical protein
MPGMRYVVVPGFYSRRLVRQNKARIIGQASPALIDADIQMGQRNGSKSRSEGADGMPSTVTVATDIRGQTIHEIAALTGVDRINAHGGVYAKCDGNWWFYLDTVVRLRVFIAKRVMLPCAIPADQTVCWKTIPSHPLVGGFLNPVYGFHCRAASIPVWWDTAIHGTPGVQLTGGSGLGDASQASQTKAETAAAKLNAYLGVGTKKQPKWWVYTLPQMVGDKAEVEVGVAGDVPGPNTGEFLQALLKLGTGATFSLQKLEPRLGDAPIDTVWPTDSASYHEPTGPGTEDDALGQGGLLVTDQGLGSAPVVAMPTGMLNWDRVTGYEGQKWEMNDPPEWAHPTGLSGESGGTPGPGIGSAVKIGLLSAGIGAAAGYIMAPVGADPKRAAVLSALGFGAAGALIGKLLGSAENWFSSVVAPRAGT